MERKSSDRIIPIVVTLVAHVAVIVLLMTAYIRSVDDSFTRKWPPVDKSELLVMEDDASYVKMGDIPQATTASSDNASEAEAEPQEPSVDIDLRNSGGKAVSPKVVTSERTSPMKVEKKEEPKPEKTGPTKEELAERQRIKEQNEIRERVASRTKFNTSGNGGTGGGNAGSPNGNSSSGVTSGTPGHTLSGRSFVSAGKPSSSKSGEIVISITVDASGKVIRATYSGGSGPAAGDASVRESCRQAALKSVFTAASVAEQTGKITWKFI